MACQSESEEETDIVDVQELLCLARNTDDVTFLYLSYAWPKSSHYFSPYKFIIMSYEKIDKNSDYLTISCRGVTYFKYNKEPEMIQLDDWERDYEMYNKLCKLRFFAKFQQWRIFCRWKKCVAKRKFESKYNLLSRNMLMVNCLFGPSLRSCLDVCSQLCDMSIGNMNEITSTVTLEKFIDTQTSSLETIEKLFSEFREMLKDVLQQACRRAFSKEGFVASRPTSSKSDVIDTDGKKIKGTTLSYVDQEKKRNLCRRLTSFLRLADCLVQNALHKILINSTEDMLVVLKNRYEKQEAGISFKPLCYIELCIASDKLELQPSEEDVKGSIQFVIRAWEKCVLSFSSFATDSAFGAFTENTKQEDTSLEMIIAGDEYLSKIQDEMLNMVHINFESINKFVLQYTPIAKSYTSNKKTQLETINNETDLDIFRIMLLNFVEQKAAVSKVASSQRVGIFLLQMDNFQQTVLPPLQELVQTVYRVLPKVGRNKVGVLSAEVQEAQAFLELLPKTTANYVEYLRFIDRTASRLPLMTEEMVYIENLHSLMQEYGVPCMKEDLNAFRAFQAGLSSLKVTVEKKMSERDSIVLQFEHEICRDMTQLLTEVASVQAAVNEASLLDIESDIEEVQLALHQLRTRLDESQSKEDYIREQQVQYQLRVPECAMLAEAKEGVRLRQLLWDSLEFWESKLEDWESQTFHTLDPEEVDIAVQQNYNIISELEAGLPANHVVDKYKSSVDNVVAKLPVIRYLRNPSLEVRHWHSIGKLVDRNLSKEESLTLHLLEDIDVFKHAQCLQEISNQATCEANLNNSMNNVESQWEQLQFQVSDYGNTFILGDMKQVYDVVDDTNIALSIIASSKFAEPIMPRVENWRKTLKLFTLTLEEWVRCQKSWLLLESFFVVPYIRRKLPMESAMFTAVNKSWIEIMESVHQNTLALQAATRRGLLAEFKKNNNLLKQILRYLEPFLESRRILFPRFYFLSNKEVLDVITKMDHKYVIQKYIRKCFMGVNRIRFEQVSDNFCASALISTQNEELTLERNITVREQIEDWLGNLNISMQETIKHMIKFGSLNCTQNFSISDLILKNPQQIVLTLAHIRWCKEIETALNNDLELQQLYGKYNEELQSLVNMMQDEETSVETKNKVSSIIIFLSHLQDVMKDLIENFISKTESFEWQRRLRMYWNEAIGQCEVRMGYATSLYGYEYVGMSPGLVHTANTERSFFSLLTALQLLNLGGCLSSSSGRGKKETVLSLAHILAVHCVIIPCSDNLTHKSLCQVLSGAVQVGAWCCFTRADLLPSSLLSSVGHQIEAIHSAKRARLGRFQFCGRNVKLNDNCGIFITIGSLRDTKLPENLKTLLRPISVPHPNEEAIAEVLLVAQGFSTSKQLASKLTQIFLLCKTQLSHNNSFCFDTRNLKRLIEELGSKRSENINENDLLLDVINSRIVPNLKTDEKLLFKAILREHFDDIDSKEESTFDKLIECVKQTAIKMGFYPNIQLMDTVLRLHELVKRGHAVILSGDPGIGKTSAWKVLQNVLSTERKTIDYVIYPMSHSRLELFGGEEIATQQWMDGLISSIMGQISQEPDCHHFIVFDGPLHESWIEGLGTFQDKNESACLGNLEQISIQPNVTIIFETLNSKDVSPSVISRCRLLHINKTDNETWVSRVKSWLNELVLAEEMKSILENLFFAKVPAGSKFIEENSLVNNIQNTTSIISTLCNLIQSQIQSENDTSVTSLPQMFIFSYFWAFYGYLSDSHVNKQLFNKFIADLFQNELKDVEFDREISKYYWNCSENKWQPFKTILNSGVKLPGITVTEKMVKIKYIAELLIQKQNSFIINGLSGCGKSTLARWITHSLDDSVMSVTASLLTHQNTEHLQKTLLQHLERCKRDVMSAPRGKHVMLHVDDVSLTRAHSHLEMFRQILDHGTLYERRPNNELNCTKTEDVMVSIACNEIKINFNAEINRFLRHCAVLSVSEPSSNDLVSIYEPALRTYLAGSGVAELSTAVTRVFVALFERMKKQFLPMPSTPFYVFTQSNLHRCIHGVTQVDVALLGNSAQLIKLVHHEFIREFKDRLISEEDIQNCSSIINEEFEKAFTEEMSRQELKLNDQIIFADFMTAKKNYVAIENTNTLVTVLQDHLETYNDASEYKMSLVLFPEFAEHVSRVCRALRHGHVLLLAKSGCGRRSITRLSVYLRSYRFMIYSSIPETTIEDFRMFLLKLCCSAVNTKQDTVIVVLDNKSMSDQSLDDLHCLIKLGNAPFFSEHEYFNEIVATITKESGVENHDNESIFNHFIDTLKRKLHIVLCMEIDENNHRTQLRRLPSLVTSCTVNWISEWPQHSLESIAKSALRIDVDDTLKSKITECAAKIHMETMRNADTYFKEENIKLKVNLSLYDELLQLYQSMYRNEVLRLLKLRDKCSNGLKKLHETLEAAEEMRQQLASLEPALNAKSANTEALLQSLLKEQAQVEKIRQIVAAEEMAVKLKSDETQAISSEAQKDIDEAIPAIETSIKALETVERNDLKDIRAMTKPPALVKFVFEAVCLLMGCKTDWGSIKALAADATFIKRAMELDRDNIPDTAIRKLKDYVEHPNFVPEIMETQSRTCRSFCMWVRAVDAYAKTFRAVLPKKKRLETAESELATAISVLRSKQQRLADAEGQVARLESHYDTSVAEQAALQAAVELTTSRLARAGHLTPTMNDEDERWSAALQEYTEMLQNLPGDLLLSAACMTYYGPFSSECRAKLNQVWRSCCQDLDVPISNKSRFIESFTNPFVLHTWHSSGLPRDNHAIENAIITTHADKWPLLIDPQELGIRWIKQLESNQGLVMTSMMQKNYLHKIEQAKKENKPILLHEVSQHLPYKLLQVLQETADTKNDEENESSTFKIYLTTRLSKPKFHSDVFTCVNLVDFSVTHQALQEQILSDVVRLESPDVEQQVGLIQARLRSDRREHLALEQNILDAICSYRDDILDDETLINNLNKDKVASDTFLASMEKQTSMLSNVQTKREVYRCVANTAATLFFVILKLVHLNPMYQYSLQSYIQNIQAALKETGKADGQTELEKRVQNLRKVVTGASLQFVAPGLEKRDRELHRVLVCMALMVQDKRISSAEWSEFVQPQISDTPMKLDKVIDILQSKFECYKNLKSNLNQGIHLIIGDFQQDITFPTESATKCDNYFNDTLSEFQKLILIKYFKKEQLSEAIEEFVKLNLQVIGNIEQIFMIKSIVANMRKLTPLVLILGSEPLAEIRAAASVHGKGSLEDCFCHIALGAGQDTKAIQLVNQAAVAGKWVYLQNCHESLGFVSREILKILQHVWDEPSSINDNFRLLIGSAPFSDFPPLLLHNALKFHTAMPVALDTEAPKFPVALAETSSILTDDHGDEWSGFVHKLCRFDSIIRERGCSSTSIGWNSSNQFGYNNLDCALRIAFKLFTWNDIFPKHEMCYYTGQTYFHCVANQWDEDCVIELLNITGISNKTSKDKTFETFKDECEALGLNKLTVSTHKSKLTLSMLQICEQRSTLPSNNSADEIIQKIKQEIPVYILESTLNLITEDDKPNYDDLAFSYVLHQEMNCYSQLIKIIHSSLENLLSVYKGEACMNETLSELEKQLLTNEVPSLWRKYSFPSVLPLTSWISALKNNVLFFEKLRTNKNALVYNLPAFYSPESLMISLIQNYARKNNTAIQNIKLVCQAYQTEDAVLAATRDGDNGLIVSGLVLDCASWNWENKMLQTQLSEMRNIELNFVHLQPTIEIDANQFYATPLYRNKHRNDLIATIFLSIPDQTEDLWPMQSTAVLLKSATE